METPKSPYLRPFSHSTPQPSTSMSRTPRVVDLQKEHIQFALNDNCSAGTGTFFAAQMQRLGLPLEKYSEMVAKAKSIPNIAGRCSVFAKTDIIHSQQAGVKIEDILQVWT